MYATTLIVQLTADGEVVCMAMSTKSKALLQFQCCFKISTKHAIYIFLKIVSLYEKLNSFYQINAIVLLTTHKYIRPIMNSIVKSSYGCYVINFQ